MTDLSVKAIVRSRAFETNVSNPCMASCYRGEKMVVEESTSGNEELSWLETNKTNSTALDGSVHNVTGMQSGKQTKAMCRCVWEICKWVS